eukprot:TRINITY_DN43153_c0_g1_i1.p1 TRINITY_DN43153_c0_g1~~TRINITY_DN43153_c0_g1_i1.p1  ORF type:complete len:380 (+),score=173.29 TRINITY_DN43153_c0_g1_i1:72-1142(+)
MTRLLPLRKTGGQVSSNGADSAAAAAGSVAREMEEDDDVRGEALLQIKERKATAGTLAMWFSSLSVSSIGMVLANKMVVQTLRLPLLTLLFQNVCSIVLNLVAAKIGWLSMRPWEVAEMMRFVVPTLIFSAMLASSLMAMPYVAVGTIVVFKCAGTVLVAVLDRVVFGVRLGNECRAALLLILSGSCLYFYTDGNYDATGYLWLGLNCACNAANNLYQKFVVVTIKQTPAGSSCYMALLSLPMVLLIAVWAGEHVDAMAKLDEQLSSLMVSVLFLTGVFGFMISLSYNTLFTISASTSIMVASTANKLGSVMLGMLFFNTSWNAKSMLGLLVSLFGAYWYATARSKEKRRVKGSDK